MTSGRWTDFGMAIAERRLALDMTQRDLADLSDVSLSTLQGLEAGRRATQVDSLHRILRVLGWALVAIPLPDARRTTGAVLLPTEQEEDGRHG